MSLHPDVIEAASVHETDNGYAAPSRLARRVLLAQAQPEAISDAMVSAAVSESLRSYHGVYAGMRAAISAALLHAAKEGE